MSKFYLTTYLEYPIFEPAEGGYYYEGRTVESVSIYDNINLENIIKDMKKMVDEENKALDISEMWFVARDDSKNILKELKETTKEFGVKDGRVLLAYKQSRYIGEGGQIYLETPASYKGEECGWRPYE